MKKIDDAIGVRISCETVDVNVCACLSVLIDIYYFMFIILEQTFLVESLMKIDIAGSPR